MWNFALRKFNYGNSILFYGNDGNKQKQFWEDFVTSYIVSYYTLICMSMMNISLRLKSAFGVSRKNIYIACISHDEFRFIFTTYV